MMYVSVFKPLIDIIVALVVLTLLLPLLVLITMLLALVNNGKPFFLQARTGKSERTFRVIKFKTMNDRRNEEGELLPDVHRLTSIGKWVRNSSLDELPQLINVLKGDMSLVGPRPFIAEYLPLYSPEQRKRFLVKPGITGWAQVNGRNTITWTKRLEYDVWYAKNISFPLDLKIVGMTIGKVLRPSDVNQHEGMTSEPFNSYN